MSGTYLGSTEAARPGELADLAALDPWLRRELPGFAGEARVRRYAGGQSNPTFLLETTDRAWVLRTRPARTLPSAHRIDREYRVMTALAGAGFPVPTPRLFCDDESVIGRPFYVMDHVAGRIFLDCRMPDLGRAERAALFDSMNAVLAQLHNLDPAQLGLADYGRPGNYFARQIERWSRQYEASRTEAVPAMDRLIEWLPQAVPDDERSALVHGDFSFHNVLVHPQEPRVIAVLDWELSTLGHPLADLTYHLMDWYRPPAGDPRGSLHGADLAALGVPTEEAYAARYSERTGVPVPADLGFYRAFNLFRVAAIIQGIVGRARDGVANDPAAALQIPRVRALAAAAWEEALRLQG